MGLDMDRQIGLGIKKSAAAETMESRKTGLAKTAEPGADWSSSWRLYRGYNGGALTPTSRGIASHNLRSGVFLDCEKHAIGRSAADD